MAVRVGTDRHAEKVWHYISSGAPVVIMAFQGKSVLVLHLPSNHTQTLFLLEISSSSNLNLCTLIPTIG